MLNEGKNAVGGGVEEPEEEGRQQHTHQQPVQPTPSPIVGHSIATSF
jgi:hypothetical protein